MVRDDGTRKELFRRCKEAMLMFVQVCLATKNCILLGLFGFRDGFQ